ncbi:uncharacterized protein LOC130281852 [Hyla sarda]|uniref:uncharacterized protein LOC130281852 n=1 Tax=Hyla sarda TaxID=327740 RepID=UPI0024C25DBA|nr:uncharacterized protein LOC130281852 [Hyla sarda]
MNWDDDGSGTNFFYSFPGHLGRTLYLQPKQCISTSVTTLDLIFGGLFDSVGGTQSELNEFCGYINHNDVNMQFTANYGKSMVEFLDVTIHESTEGLKVKGYRKPTSTNSLLHFNSFHPNHVCRSLPYGQFLRIRRNNSEYSSFLEQSCGLMDRLRDQGYEEQIIYNCFQRACKDDRKQLLFRKRKYTKTRTQNRRAMFSFEYSPMSEIMKKVRKNWHILQADKELTGISSEPPLISICRTRNLRDVLVKGQLATRREN